VPTRSDLTSIPRRIHQTARTKDLSSEEQRLARRLRRHLPGWSYTLWSDADNRALIARCFPDHLSQYDRIQAGVMKADIARVAALYEQGGFYFDTDYKLVRPISEVLLMHGCILAIERGSIGAEGSDLRFSADFRLGNAVLAAAPGHRLLADFVNHIFAQLETAPRSEIALMKISGPHALTRFYLDSYRRFNDVWLAPQSVFLPDLTLGGLSYAADAATLGVHLCWGSWRAKHRMPSFKNLFRRTLTSLT
jgi:mannosyltransferase OCH1-like enzyme